MISIHYACVMVLLFALSGCTGTCTNSGIEGAYELSANGASYSLELRADGQGVLSASGKPIGDLRWTLSEVPSQQILELDAIGAVYKTLSEISALRINPATPAVSPNISTQGMVGSEPVCARGGHMKKLVINYEEPLAFKRSKNKS
jgi:hypothetical protein